MQYKQIIHGPDLIIEFSSSSEKISSVKLSLNDKKGLLWCFTGSKNLEVKVADWMEAYCQKNSLLPSLPINLEGFTPFQTKVYAALLQLPFGSILTYAEVAEIIGHPDAYRAVGSACGKNLCPLLIPCHRVVSTGGKMGGFTGGIEIKKRLLKFEGPA